jgi:hypothetical protein
MADYYQQMQNLAFREKGYISLPLEGGAWSLLYKQDAKKFEEAGWKFHLSVHPDDVSRAWNIIVDEMVNDGSVPQHAAKVARAKLISRFADPADAQAGKMIVIYTHANVDPEHYQRLLERIERRLKADRIRSGPDVKRDRKIPGSAFIFYRNDRDLTGEYNAAAQNASTARAWQYNPNRKLDPYEVFSISDKPVNPAISGARSQSQKVF